MRYARDRPLWRQRRWWEDGLAFALLFPLVVTALGGGEGPLGGSLVRYLVDVGAALAGWGLIGWLASGRGDG